MSGTSASTAAQRPARLDTGSTEREQGLRRIDAAARLTIDAFGYCRHVPRVLLERYELGEVIGAGGMARVHRGRDMTLDRPVAVKVLDDMAARSADPAARDRFLNEARSAASFGHDHAVAIYDAGEDDGVLFIVMELVDGTTLAAELARRGSLQPDEAVSIVTQILDGLAAMHRASIVHRDVKPANILLDRHGRVKLTDFGIAKRLDDIDDALTSAGSVIGTPRYLAPEQAVGGSLGPPTDIYLVGAVLHEMLTGERPPSVLNGALRQPADPRRLRPEIPATLAVATMRALEYRPEDRFQTAAEMREAVEAVGTTDVDTGFSSPAPAVGRTGDSAATMELAHTSDRTAVMPAGHSTGEPTRLLTTAPIEAGERDACERDPNDGAATTNGAATTSLSGLESTRANVVTPLSHLAPSRDTSRPSDPSTPPRRRWQVPVAVGAIAALLTVGIGLALWDGRTDVERAAAVAGDDGGAVSSDQFLTRLREDPAQFGSKGPQLRAKLEAVLEETNPRRRAEKIESLRIDIFGWAAEGKIDVSVGEQVETVLDG